MSKNELKHTQTSKKLRAIELDYQIPVIIPNNVFNKIRYLCKEISKVEWSGILFYTVKGSIEKETAKITLKDILLMDKGTGGATEYEHDEDIVMYQMESPERIDWHKGHIHSHNTMNVFFSSTDRSELEDNCDKYNIYLSIIVNNFYDIIGKVVYQAKPVNYSAKDEKGKEYEFSLASDALEELMIVHECKIDRPEMNIPVPQDLINRISEVEKKKAEKFRNRPEPQGTGFHMNNQWNKNAASARPLNPMLPVKAPFPDWEKDKNNGSEWNAGKIDKVIEKDLKERIRNAEEITLEQFTCTLLRLGTELSNDTLDEALADIDNAGLEAIAYTECIFNGFERIYDEFFEGNTNFIGNPESFLTVLSGVIAMFEKDIDFYPSLEHVIKALKQLGTDRQTKINNINHTAKQPQEYHGD